MQVHKQPISNEFLSMYKRIKDFVKDKNIDMVTAKTNPNRAETPVSCFYRKGKQIMETIEGVGIVVEGKLYTLPRPNRHHHVIHLIYQETGEQVDTDSQGFVTSSGRYVEREEALEIARNAGQLLPCHFHKTQLFSESVW